ncbi:GNAT family N-acetyltransferase [Dyella psychrodurans]|uniref:N-acetyltransferase n=1 Tax=Dyella psychrodurans TaxID=1927960 RepID=A0A370X4I0_9GAMM|nr:GNAT family N-acetyltransferase [Dyella psychrodurans]RDS83180.1 N-acetyltransferase [Dyella psychrodurans]
MQTPIIDITDQPDPADLAVVRAGLDHFNATATGIDDQRPLAIWVKDPDSQQVIGGVTGRTSRGLLFVDMLFLPEALRGAGVGSKLLKMAEQEGSRRGCRVGLLHTHAFQAPEFYRRHGWRELGSIPCDPPGNRRFTFTKELSVGDDD